MKNSAKVLTLLFSILVAASIVGADNASPQQALPLPTMGSMPTIIPSPPTLDATAYVLLDANSGSIIAEKNANKRMPPASLTKIMTLYIIANELQQGQIHLEDKVRISKDAWKMGGSRMFVKVGTSVPVSKLIQGIIVASGNDATHAMAEYIGGNEENFVKLMNQTAASLQMTGSNFEDSNGLPAKNHYSTPMDIAKLARAWILTFPDYYQSWFKQKWITYNKIRQPNRNRLLWRDQSVDGMKTGHTSAAGYCLVSSAKRNGMRLISVVMGAPTDSARASDSEALLNYGFRFYESHKLYDANIALTKPRVWFGRTKTVPLGLTEPLYVTIPAGQYKNITPTMKLNGKTLQAPIKKGEIYGTLTVTLNKRVLATKPLVALQNDPKGGFFSRFTDHISKFFHKWF